jgi:CrcB protein
MYCVRRWSSPLTARKADDSYEIDLENSIVAYLWIALGAVAGASARYFLSGTVTKAVSSSFPCGTLLINISGSLLLGFFLVLTTERVLVDVRWRWLIAIGFCGSYTTFSSYAFETFALFEQGQWILVAWNVIASNLLCLAAVLTGAALARWL